MAFIWPRTARMSSSVSATLRASLISWMTDPGVRNRARMVRVHREVGGLLKLKPGNLDPAVTYDLAHGGVRQVRAVVDDRVDGSALYGHWWLWVVLGHHVSFQLGTAAYTPAP